MTDLARFLATLRMAPANYGPPAGRIRNDAACLASLVIPVQSRALMRVGGASQEPPTQATLGKERYSGAVANTMPPVGQKLICGNSSPKIRRAPTPPACAAGKNFSAK